MTGDNPFLQYAPTTTAPTTAPSEDDNPFAKYKPQSTPKSALESAVSPIENIGHDIYQDFNEGQQFVQQGQKDYAAGGLRNQIVSPLETAAGYAEEISSPVTGSARALLGDPIKNALGGGAGAQIAGNTATDIATMLTPGGVAKVGSRLTETGGGLLKSLMTPVKNFVGTAKGVDKAQGAEALRKNVSEKIGEQTESYEQQVAEYNAKVQRADAALQQLKTQPQTAEGRANAAAARSPGWVDERQKVLADIRDRTRAHEHEARMAGEDADKAHELAAQHEQKLAEVEAASDALEKDLLARPGVSQEEFGKKLQETTQALHDKYSEQRAQESGYKAALDSAGSTLRVDTADIHKKIDDVLKDVRNPDLAKGLKEIQTQLSSPVKLKSGKQGLARALSVKSADSLRGYLDKVIHSNQMGELKVDKETLNAVRDIRNSLSKATNTAWAPLEEATAKWRALSRPLDIVERKGALKHVLNVDPLSGDYAVTEAQVAKSIIDKAKAGNPVFTRLLKENPNLQKSGRLAFTQDLFGKETVPTEAALNTWLKSNEVPLKQLGLYDEFRDIRTARETAAQAVKEAKGSVGEAQVEAREKESVQREAQGKVRQAQSLRSAEQRRIDAAQKTEQTAHAEHSKQVAKDAAEADRRLNETKRKNMSAADRAKGVSDHLSRLQIELDNAPVKEVHARARSAIQNMYREGLMSKETYEQITDQIERVHALHGATAEARIKLKKVLGYALGAGLAYEVGHHVL